MKKLFFLTIMMFASTAWARSDLNTFKCQSLDGSIRINFATTSFVGEPSLFVYEDGEQVFPPQNLQDERGVQIQIQDTIFGKLVFGQDMSRVPVDAPAYIYGFLVPTTIDGDFGLESFSSLYMSGYVGGYIPNDVPVQRLNQHVDLSCEGMTYFY